MSPIFHTYKIVSLLLLARSDTGPRCRCCSILLEPQTQVYLESAVNEVAGEGCAHGSCVGEDGGAQAGTALSDTRAHPVVDAQSVQRLPVLRADADECRAQAVVWGMAHAQQPLVQQQSAAPCRLAAAQRGHQLVQLAVVQPPC